MTNNLYCIVGPSGSGKSTLAASLAEKGFRETRSHTTRACRGGSDVNAYHFVSEGKFRQMIATGEMLEHVEYAGNYYGTSVQELMVSDFILVELGGVKNLKQHYKGRPIKVIGLNASTEELKSRLASRTDDSPNRVEDDKSRFHNLSAVCDCYISSRSAQDTLEIALDFILLSEGREVGCLE